MSTANKLSYLNDTKSLLRTSLNKFGSSILSTDTFRSYDTKLNEIYDKLPKITATGQGLTISNVQNGLLDDFKMNGVDLEQDTTETIIINEWEQGDISGSTGDTISDNSTIRTQQYIKVFPNVLYNISRTIYNSFMKFRFYDTNYNFLGTQGNVNITTNVSEDRMTANVSSMQLTINDSSVAYMKISDASNNLNTIYTITTNNTPSPSYPQDIKVVEGRQVINVKGKNLWGGFQNSFPKTNTGIDFVTNKDGTITANGTANGTAYSMYGSEATNNGFLKTLPAGNYVISGATSEIAINVVKSDGTGIVTTGSNLIATFTLSEETQIFVRLQIYNKTVNNVTIKPMLESGSTATDYEPYYNPVGYNINLHGKNLFDKDNEIVGYVYNSSGELVISPNWNTNNEFKKINNNKISLSCKTTYPISFLLIEFDSNKTFIQRQQSTTTNYTFTLNNNTNYLKFCYLNNVGTYDIQLEEGAIITSYEEYYNYKLAKMPNTDYKNRIYKNNGNWYFEEKVKKIVLDGSQYWNLANSGTDNYSYRLVLGRRIINGYGISSHYPYQSSIVASNTVEGFNILNITNTTSQIRIRYGTEQTTENFRSWLSNHNVTVWYVLENSTTTQITNTTLINQLEVISVHTGTNIITISNDNNIIPEIEITRLKELEKLS